MENISEKIFNLRKDYANATLNESDLNPNPIKQFQFWLNQALEAGLNEPYAMQLATSGSDNFPDIRTVLLRGADQDGFTFFTNYNSEKGRDIAENPKAAINFFWPELERQVRVRGTIKKASTEISDEYFNSRPFESKIGAWASNQSSELPSRELLENKIGELTKKFQNKEVPRPDFWGGYVLTPSEIEFWQGRPSRLHDRILFKLQDDKWKMSRLNP
jgi:pyridoxamine 5'-phosphate oxidase